MPILYLAEKKIFKLDTPSFTHAFTVSPTGHLDTLYSGASVPETGLTEQILHLQRAYVSNPAGGCNADSLEIYPQEYASAGVSDYRTPSFVVRTDNGSTVTDPVYVSHRIFQGKPELEGLPSSYDDSNAVETLEITLEDSVSGIRFLLYYSVFRDCDAVARSVKILNAGAKTVYLEKAASLTADFYAEDFDVITFPGAWSRERHAHRAPAAVGTQILASRRGLSSHQMNPAFILAAPETTEDSGKAYGFLLVYSGNFQAEIEKDLYENLRVQFGINPETFTWKLEPGKAFSTPECVEFFSANGLARLSNTSHEFIRKHIVRGPWRDQIRPILINNWEATYFDFNAEKLLKIAKKAAELGVEMLVMDDGWFGKRNDDTTSLGDWFINETKLPGGFAPLIRKINALGMKFGLWFEPEMVSRDSELFRQHPDWCIHVPGRAMSEGRHQYVLDMSRPEVVELLFNRISAILESANIEYIKWDANRHLTEVYSAELPPDRQKELPHRYVMGVYELHARLLKKFPNLLIEGCSGGGGRFDAGILCYAPQIWTTDDTDAVERLAVQYGTSFFYPCSAMGAHVSACPNHLVGRTTPFHTRGIVAMAGTFGYELDLNNLPPEEQTQVKTQIAAFKKIQKLVAFGNYYRLTESGKDNTVAWMHVSGDRSEAVVSAVTVLARPNPKLERIRLRGLEPDAVYADDAGTEYSGALLMNGGLILPPQEGDFTARQICFRKIR